MAEGIKKSLSSWLQDFNELSSKLSDMIRNLAFAGIGIIWIFKNTDENLKLLPAALSLPLILIVLSLIADIFQYLWTTVNIYIFYRINEYNYDNGKLTEEQIEDLTIGNYVDIVSWIFFIIKIIFIVIAYIKIYFFLSDKIY